MLLLLQSDVKSARDALSECTAGRLRAWDHPTSAARRRVCQDAVTPCKSHLIYNKIELQGF